MNAIWPWPSNWRRKQQRHNASSPNRGKIKPAMAEITIWFCNSFSQYANGRTQWPVTLADGSSWLCYA